MSDRPDIVAEARALLALDKSPSPYDGTIVESARRAACREAVFGAAPRLLAALCDEVARLRARRAVSCERCIGRGFVLMLKGAGVMDREKCLTCAGSGATFVDGDSG